MVDNDGNYSSKEFTDFAENLWNNDENALFAGTDYELDTQGKTRYSKGGIDKAEDPLFVRVESKALQKPTFKAFIALLDNYESETGVEEVVTNEERKENWTFINAIFDTTCMKLAHKFLVAHGKASQDVDKFKREFHDMWFKLYKRDHHVRGGDSSGFEHVFVGETREDEVIGFHNWIQFYLEEKRGKIDYMGFMSSDRNPNFLTVQFAWNKDVKPKGSMFVGVSPEFEISLYTACYLMGHDSYLLTVGGEPIMIKAYKTAGKIGTTFAQVPPYKKH
jgi:poly(U)-specific endoribonuclease